MKLVKYLKDKILFIVLQTVICNFLFFVLKVYHVNNYAITLTVLAVILANIFWLIFDYTFRFLYYKKLLNNLAGMEEKYLIAGLLEEAHFTDAEILNEVIKETTKAMNDEIASYKITQDEYREYIETWIHEIKTPLSCIDIICKNNRNDVTRKIAEETQKVDNYIEQALFYARSTNVVADYSIKKLILADVVKNTVKKNSKQLIACHTQVYFDLNDFTVYADEKWLDFIIGQIVANSIKYKKENPELSFFGAEDEDSVILSIKDNGIGIPESDQAKVFEKGFTGKNGRSFAKSTGIGLYLCRILCEKMYLGLKIQSTVGEGTTLQIIFPKDRQLFMQ
ncbi:sensor histidine kinase [Anaerotignum sp.]|uniref:sensor histidine kinase n=1 Tax=Anaerotignum sp. TaxID=2039241 RepID=UPI002714B6FE|nr:sensor histidine kinase [Anaerotignum sp.]